MAYRGGNSMLAGVQSGLQSIQTGLDKRKERKEKQKQEENLLKGVSQMMEHPAVAKYFPEDFDPYEVGAEGTLGAMDMVSRAMEMERLQTQTDQTRLQNQQAERGISENDKFMRQLHQHAQGVGEGVYRPEVRESYRDLLQESPMAAAAAETGVSPETLQRYGIGLEPAEAPEPPTGYATAKEAQDALRELDAKGQVTQKADGRYQIQFQEAGPDDEEDLAGRVVDRAELDELMSQYNINAEPLEGGKYRLKSIRPQTEDFITGAIRRGFEQYGGVGGQPGEGGPQRLTPGGMDPEQQPRRTPGGILESMERQLGQ